MKYIWINPVVTQMYQENKLDLNNMLKERGYHPLIANMQIPQKVRTTFVQAAKTSNNIVLDTRCPLAIDSIKKHINTKPYTIPNIYPILIHIAFDLHHEYIKDKEACKLYIVCPCEELAQLGRRLSKEQNRQHISFYNWEEFAQLNNIPMSPPICRSPIPLGFFDETSLNVKKLTGENQILEVLTNPQTLQENQVEFVEMLWCQDGCHNGNGVIM